MAEHEQLVVAIGPYLLGALDASTRRRVRDHLGTCEVCRNELVRLSSVPGLLAQVPKPSVGSEEPPAALRDRLVANVVAERTAERRRNLLVKAAGAALIIVLPSLVVLVMRLTAPGAELAPALSPMASTGLVESVAGEAAVEDRDWGSALTVVMDGAPADERLVLFVETPDGRREQAAAWAANGEEIRATGATSFRAQDIARLLVTRLNGEELLILET